MILFNLELVIEMLAKPTLNAARRLPCRLPSFHRRTTMKATYFAASLVAAVAAVPASAFVPSIMPSYQVMSSTG